ncbi:MAG: DNA polymerase III subunit delta [Pseudonocardia sp.]|nr:DNA polymerase III subunit delta [Pseudonocardia sp.]
MAPAPVRLVLGEEELLVERAVADVVAEVRESEPGAELRRYRASELTPVALADALSPSLFAEGRVVVVQAAHDAGKDLAGAIVEQSVEPAEGIVLVVAHAGGARNKALADQLRKGGAVVTSCERVRWPEQRAEFVAAEVRRAGGRISRDAVEMVVEAVGADLRELASATAQLVADTGGTVDGVAVRRYHRGHAEVTGWTVADKAMAGDRAGALEALRWAQAGGVAAVLIADALADGVRTVARVGSAGGGDPYRLAATLGMPSGKIRKAQQQVRNWRPAGLVAAFAVAAQLNAEVKGAAADPAYALELAVMRICDARGVR